jgi:hypothetical protein
VNGILDAAARTPARPAAHRAPHGLVPALATILLVAGGCTRTADVPRADWGAIPRDANVHVRTTGGVAYDLRDVAFTTQGLIARRGERTEPTRAAIVDSIRIPLDSVAAVRIRRLDRQRTSLLVAGAILGGYILIAQGQGDAEPEPPPPPPSCPFIYSFDGTRYVFDSETYAGAIARGLERTDVDNLDHLRAIDGRYRLLLTNERDETHYTDELTLLVADHPRGTRVIPDAAGVPHIVGSGIAPASLRELPADTLPARAGWEGTFRVPDHPSRVALVVRARNTGLAPFALTHILTLLGPDVYRWYEAMNDGGVDRDRVREWVRSEGHLTASVLGERGWSPIGALPDVGPAIAKTQIIVLDLTGRTGDTIRVRLESSPMLWTLEQIELAPYHGVAATIALPPARAAAPAGLDARALLARSDRRYLVATRGDTVMLEYDAPPEQPGMARTTLARTTGHYYIAADDRGPRRSEMVARMMTDRAFAQRYLLEEWEARSPGTARREPDGP